MDSEFEASLSGLDTSVQLSDNEYHLISNVFAAPDDPSAKLVYGDWLEENGFIFAAIAYRLDVAGFEWRRVGRVFHCFLAPHEHPCLVSRVLGMCCPSTIARSTGNVDWWSLAPSSEDPNEQWELELEHFRELGKMLATEQEIQVEYRGISSMDEAVMNVLGVANYWHSVVDFPRKAT